MVGRDATPYQSLIDEALRQRNSAIQNLRSCNLNGALNNANTIRNNGNTIASRYGQIDQGNILIKDANEIIRAVNALNAGQGYNFYDIATGRYIKLSPCGGISGGITGSGGGGILLPILIVGGLVVGIGALLYAVSKIPTSGAETPKTRPKMRGLMQYGGETPGRVLSTKPMAGAPTTFGPMGPRGPVYSPGSEGVHEVPASFPTAEGGRPIGGTGITAPPPTAPPVSNLRLSMAGNMVRLEWDPPQYDASKGELIGYEVYRHEEVQWSTTREKISLDTLEPEVRGYEVPHMERSGNYGVRPIYRTPEGVVFGPGFGGATF